VILAAVAAAGCCFEALVSLEVRCAAYMSELVVVVAVAMIL
jgi:hypothetical protein